VVREGVGAGGRNDPSIVCTYELKKKVLSSTQTLKTHHRCDNSFGSLHLSVFQKLKPGKKPGPQGTGGLYLAFQVTNNLANRVRLWDLPGILGVRVLGFGNGRGPRL
jgi:hypothetical protein